MVATLRASRIHPGLGLQKLVDIHLDPLFSDAKSRPPTRRAPCPFWQRRGCLPCSGSAVFLTTVHGMLEVILAFLREVLDNASWEPSIHRGGLGPVGCSSWALRCCWAFLDLQSTRSLAALKSFLCTAIRFLSCSNPLAAGRGFVTCCVRLVQVCSDRPHRRVILREESSGEQLSKRCDRLLVRRRLLLAVTVHQASSDAANLADSVVDLVASARFSNLALKASPFARCQLWHSL